MHLVKLSLTPTQHVEILKYFGGVRRNCRDSLFVSKEYRKLVSANMSETSVSPGTLFSRVNHLGEIRQSEHIPDFFNFSNSSLNFKQAELAVRSLELGRDSVYVIDDILDPILMLDHLNAHLEVSVLKSLGIPAYDIELAFLLNQRHPFFGARIVSLLENLMQQDDESDFFQERVFSQDALMRISNPQLLLRFAQQAEYFFHRSRVIPLLFGTLYYAILLDVASYPQYADKRIKDVLETFNPEHFVSEDSLDSVFLKDRHPGFLAFLSDVAEKLGCVGTG